MEETKFKEKTKAILGYYEPEDDSWFDENKIAHLDKPSVSFNGLRNGTFVPFASQLDDHKALSASDEVQQEIETTLYNLDLEYQQMAQDESNSEQTCGFITKDSGKRQEFSTGMQRDTQDGKPRYDLIPLAFLKIWAMLMSRGAEKYGARNWEKANTKEELDRFESSAFWHLMQYLEGDRSEDHATAVAFNVAAAEFVRDKLK